MHRNCARTLALGSLLASAMIAAGCGSAPSTIHVQALGPRVDVAPPGSAPLDLRYLHRPMALGAGDVVGDQVYGAYLARRAAEQPVATATAPVKMH